MGEQGKALEFAQEAERMRAATGMARSGPVEASISTGERLARERLGQIGKKETETKEGIEQTYTAAEGAYEGAVSDYETDVAQAGLRRQGIQAEFEADELAYGLGLSKVYERGADTLDLVTRQLADLEGAWEDYGSPGGVSSVTGIGKFGAESFQERGTTQQLGYQEQLDKSQAFLQALQTASQEAVIGEGDE